jgi:hypothetical protein
MPNAKSNLSLLVDISEERLHLIYAGPYGPFEKNLSILH